MDAVFCEPGALWPWVIQNLAMDQGFTIRQANQRSIESGWERIEWFREAHQHACTTVETAAWIVTELLKGECPFEGSMDGFPVRKAFARHAAAMLGNKLKLLSADASNFRHAQELFLELCVHGTKESYAQFSEYIDAAIILSARDDFNIVGAIADHPHLPYILRKKRWPGLILQ